MKYYIFLLLFCCSFSCSIDGNRHKISAINANKDIYIIDIKHASKKRSINISDIFKSVKVIILETTDDALIGEISSLEIYNDFIVITDAAIANSVFVFDKSGNFVRKIGSKGNATGEYVTVASSSIDYENGEIYLYDFTSNKINRYDLFSGKFIESIILDENDYMTSYIQYFNDKIYATAIPVNRNFSDDSFMLLELDLNDNNHRKFYLKSSDYNKGWNGFFSSGTNFFQNGNGIVKYVQMFMDTVVSINKNGIFPYLVLNSDNWISKKDIEDIKNYSDMHNGLLPNDILFRRNISYGISNFLELNNIIYFQYQNAGKIEYVIYDKMKRETTITESIIDNIVYNHSSDAYPTFVYADTIGFYRYFPTDNITYFKKLLKEGTKLPNDVIDKINETSEDSNPILLYYEQ